MHQHLVLLFLATSEIEQAGAGGVSPNAHSKCVGSDTVWVSLPDCVKDVSTIRVSVDAFVRSSCRRVRKRNQTPEEPPSSRGYVAEQVGHANTLLPIYLEGRVHRRPSDPHADGGIVRKQDPRLPCLTGGGVRAKARGDESKE
jgi:hypothetical protein